MPSISSPCTGVCTIEDATALCLGCGRSLDEIIAWAGLSEPQRLGIMEMLPGRLAIVPIRDASARPEPTPLS